jgi:4-hydroxybenzoate polyprenyltransferase
MYSRDTAEPWGDAPPSFEQSARRIAVPSQASRPAAILLWAAVASTARRVRRGEGALLVVNLSIVAWLGAPGARGLAAGLVSVLALGLMYALNDLCDAPDDLHNPKKDRALVEAYLAHRRLGLRALVVGKLLTVAFAFAALGPRVGFAVSGVMVVNAVYSTVLKGVPVLDVVWCGLWGALYAALVTTSPRLIGFVGLMTAICHLYQTLDDRVSDAANGITTTAVRSSVLSGALLAFLSALVVVALRGSFGSAWALTGAAPLVFYAVAGTPFAGWILTKIYFGVVWLALLELARAAG